MIINIEIIILESKSCSYLKLNKDNCCENKSKQGVVQWENQTTWQWI